MRGCSNQDLRILEEQPRWPKFINQISWALPDGSGTEAIVEAIRHEMLPMYRLLSQCMEYYGYRSRNADPFDMSQNAFFSLLRDSSLLDDKRRLSRGASMRGPAPAPPEHPHSTGGGASRGRHQDNVGTSPKHLRAGQRRSG